MADEVLRGGVANAGAVVRRGEHVLRPSNPHTGSIHRFLTALHETGFDGASVPVGVDPDGRERLVFVPGEVAVAPFPDWFQTDAVLASIADLMRRFHDATRAFDPTGETWSDEMVDPAGGPVVVHNDVCPENVVLRDGVAVALLDFDFAAPGRPVYDLAAMARMCGPVDDDASAARLGWGPVDQPARLRLVADTYGLEADGRHELVALLGDTFDRGGEFVLRRVEAGDPNFIQMWEEMGGMERFDRRRRWWTEARAAFEVALA
jgi:Phosphotransferase enzyme family